MYSNCINKQIESKPKEHQSLLYRIEISLKKQCNPLSIDIRRVRPGQEYDWEYDFKLRLLRKHLPLLKEMIIREDGWCMLVCPRAIVYELKCPIVIFEEPILKDELTPQNENTPVEVTMRLDLLIVRTIPYEPEEGECLRDNSPKEDICCGERKKEERYYE